MWVCVKRRHTKSHYHFNKRSGISLIYDNLWTNPHFGHMLKQVGGVTFGASKDSGSIHWNLRQKQVQDNLDSWDNMMALPSKDLEDTHMYMYMYTYWIRLDISRTWAAKIGNQQQFQIIRILPTKRYEFCPWNLLISTWSNVDQKPQQYRFQQQHLGFPVAIFKASSWWRRRPLNSAWNDDHELFFGHVEREGGGNLRMKNSVHGMVPTGVIPT